MKDCHYQNLKNVDHQYDKIPHMWALNNNDPRIDPLLSSPKVRVNTC